MFYLVLQDEAVVRCELIGMGALKSVRYLTTDFGYRKVVDPHLLTHVNRSEGDVVDSQRQWNSNPPSISVTSNCWNDNDEDEIESPWKPIPSTATDIRSDIDVDRKSIQPLLFASKLSPSNGRSPSEENNSRLDHRVETLGCGNREQEPLCDNLVDNDDYCIPLGNSTATAVQTATR